MNFAQFVDSLITLVVFLALAAIGVAGAVLYLVLT